MELPHLREEQVAKLTMYPAMTLITPHFRNAPTRRVFMYNVDLPLREKIQIINHQNRGTEYQNVWQMRCVREGFTGQWEGMYGSSEEALAALQDQ
jgi:hypothetical protein